MPKQIGKDVIKHTANTLMPPENDVSKKESIVYKTTHIPEFDQKLF